MRFVQTLFLWFHFCNQFDSVLNQLMRLSNIRFFWICYCPNGYQECEGIEAWRPTCRRPLTMSSLFHVIACHQAIAWTYDNINWAAKKNFYEIWIKTRKTQVASAKNAYQLRKQSRRMKFSGKLLGCPLNILVQTPQNPLVAFFCLHSGPQATPGGPECTCVHPDHAFLWGLLLFAKFMI